MRKLPVVLAAALSAGMLGIGPAASAAPAQPCNCTSGQGSFDIAPHSGTNLGWNGLSIGGYP